MLLLNMLIAILPQVELNVSSSATAAYWRTTWRPLRQNFSWNTDIITGMSLLYLFFVAHKHHHNHYSQHHKLLEIAAVTMPRSCCILQISATATLIIVILIGTLLAALLRPHHHCTVLTYMHKHVLFAVLQLGGDLPPLEVDTTSLSGTVTASSVTETVTGSEPLTGSTVAVEVTLNGQDWTGDGKSHIILTNTANICIVSL
jgi:hypothetical protein